MSFSAAVICGAVLFYEIPRWGIFFDLKIYSFLILREPLETLPETDETALPLLL